MQALVERAYHLWMIGPIQRTSMYKLFSARSWRNVEPGSDDVAPGRPELAESIGQELSTRGLTAHDVAAIAGFAEPTATPCSAQLGCTPSDRCRARARPNSPVPTRRRPVVAWSSAPLARRSRSPLGRTAQPPEAVLTARSTRAHAALAGVGTAAIAVIRRRNDVRDQDRHVGLVGAPTNSAAASDSWQVRSVYSGPA